MDQKPTGLISFFRYIVVAGIATFVDFSLFIILANIFKIWYVVATLLSSVSGGIIAFLLERNWTFVSKDGKISYQALRYLIVWIASIALNTYGLYIIVEFIYSDRIIAKVLVSAIVGIGFNFLMHNYFVFQKNSNSK